MTSPKQNNNSLNSYIHFLKANKQNHSQSNIPGPDEWLGFAKTVLEDFQTEEKLKDYHYDLLQFFTKYKHHRSMALLAGIKWIDLAAFHTTPFSNTRENNRTKTQIPIPQDFMGPRFSRSRVSSEIFNKKTNLLGSSPRSQPMTGSLKIEGLDKVSLDSSKEIVSEQISDRILDYLSHEITHGKNLFKDLIDKFSELFAARYQRYLPAEQRIRTEPGTPIFSARQSTASVSSNTVDCKPKKLSEQSIPVNKGDLFKKCYLPRVISKATVSKVIKDVKEFINFLEILLYQVVYRFILQEGGSMGLQFDKKLKQTVHIAVFHPSTQIYNTCFKIIEQHFDLKQRNIDLHIEKWRSLLPEDFNIEATFCLNEDELPYLGAIEVLNMLNTLFTPTEKLKIIRYMKDEIVRAVDNYWYKKDPLKKVSELTISADQLVPIYTYIVAKSGNKRIKANLFFIEALLEDQFVKFGEEAYFFATLSISTDYVIGLAVGMPESNQSAEESKQSIRDDDSIRRINTADTLRTPSQINSLRKNYSMMLIEEVDEASRIYPDADEVS